MAGEVRDQGWWGLRGSPSYDGGEAGGEKATAQEGMGARMKGRGKERHLGGD